MKKFLSLKKILLFTVLISLALYPVADNLAENLSAAFYCIINGNKISLEVADNDYLREKGLMYRNSIGENQGMIFIFDRQDYVNFWMKNVKFPLDILFISGDKIAKIYNMADVCRKDPCPFYPSKSKVSYTIELKGGFCRKNKIKTGQKVFLSRELKEKISSIQN